MVGRGTRNTHIFWPHHNASKLGLMFIIFEFRKKRFMASIWSNQSTNYRLVIILRDQGPTEQICSDQ